MFLAYEFKLEVRRRVRKETFAVVLTAFCAQNYHLVD